MAPSWAGPGLLYMYSSEKNSGSFLLLHKWYFSREMKNHGKNVTSELAQQDIIF